MAFQVPSLNILLIAPVVIVAGWGMLLMLIEMFISDEQQKQWLDWAPWLTLVGLAVALVQTLGMWDLNGGTFMPVGGEPMIVVDNFATFLNVIFILTGMMTVLVSVNYMRRTGLERAEFYMLVLFSTSGMMLMGMANDLILVFLALELLSIPLYIMSGLAWPRTDSEESAMKYFLLGAFSSGFLVFGIALTYGATGSTQLPVVLAGIASGGSLALAGAAFLLVGFAFKVAAVPFHMWTPDVYQGAPTSVTAFMSVGAKVGGFAAMLRVFVTALPQIGDTWVTAVAALSALTLIVGNFVALAQPNIKRMLAYSSIAHAGYIMIAVASSTATPDGVSSALFYMFAYLFTTMGAFAVVIAVERKTNEGVTLDDYKGLAKRSPLLALAMAYFMLSLTGVPPTGGFSGKFFVFRAAIEANLVWLAIIGVITSVVSGYYYLRVVYMMYMMDGEGEVQDGWGLNGTAVAIAVLATLILGFLPGTWFDIVRQAALHGVQVLAGG
ncbi:MAG: NADH-quinone oxidoreductase subunit N [Ardenticatenaceae bacterium]|nr:NADH-quinone oxidoreductase subunit N [Ardenticatenaceae bacterium]MCB9445156.1 NADH-quinone oxidoreductase subunit N [Ardenticatenaceae bacterium]